MEYIQAIILGIVQGFTEFLPISSSGHLMLIPVLTKWQYFGKFFDVALHLGTFIALLIYYRQNVVKLIKDFIESLKHIKNYKEIADSKEYRLPWLLLISVIPGGLVGVLFDDIIEDTLSKPVIAAACLIIFGIVLSAAETYSQKKKFRTRPDSNNITLRDAIIIGCAQALALIPGVSRSGSTMTAAMFLGMKKVDAANISFLMSMPIIGGAAAYSFIKMMIKTPEVLSSIGIFTVGIIASGISGYFVIKFLLDFLKKYSFSFFMYYRIALGLILIGLSIFGVLK